MQQLKKFLACILGLFVFYYAQAQPKIARVEYYIDKDPGYGAAIKVNGISGNDVQNKTISVQIDTLGTGLHLMGIRALDDSGAWSLDNIWLFYKPEKSVNAAPSIKRVEYYVDKDPGYGLANKVDGVSGNDISNKVISVKIDTLAVGLHVLGIRALDSSGAWSLDNRWLFYKPDAANTPIPNITRIEYYIDKDPGYGKGIEVAIENAKDFPNVNLFVNISTLKAGAHALGIRSKDANGKWSLDNVDSFMVGSVVAAPSITVNSISLDTICSGGRVKVGYQKQGIFNSTNKFIVQLSNSAGKFDNPKNIGSDSSTANDIIVCTIPAGLQGNKFKVRVISTSPKDTSANTIDSIVINSTPATPTVSSNIPVTNVCLKDTVKLTCNDVAASYKWNTGDTTKSIMVDTSGNYSVTVFNASGCSATSNITKVMYDTCAKPADPKAIKITATTATLKWRTVSCTIKYKLQYRIKGGTFTTVNSVPDTSYALSGLMADTVYQWHVATVCKTLPIINSEYSKLVNFTTHASFAVNNASILNNSNSLQAVLFPNPTKDKAFVSIKNAKGSVQVMLSDMNGKELWRSDKVFSNIISIPVRNLAGGNYLVRIMDDKNVIVLKMVKE